MATRVQRVRMGIQGAQELAQAPGSLRFDALMVLLCSWFLGGAYLDAWAHNHLGSALETFFTPWHGVLYAGGAAVSVFLVFALLRNRWRGHAWRRALPAGYGLSLVGVLLFALGGLGDMIWHLLFGIERRLDAALSPTHLWLALAFVLITSGPFRAAWHRPLARSAGGWRELLPMLLSLALAISAVTLIVQYAHPLVMVVAAHGGRSSGDLALALGVSSIMLQSVILMGPLLLALRRWSLPPGALTLVLTLNALLLSFMRDQQQLVPAIALAGLAGDLLLIVLRPTPDRPSAFRLFAAALPACYYLCYFLALQLLGGIAWTVHGWTGALALAGAAGWGLSYLLLPPPVPEA